MKYRRLLSGVLAFCMAVGFYYPVADNLKVEVPTVYAETLVYDNLKYEVTDNCVVITGCTDIKTVTKINIPKEIDGLEVVEIGNRAFEGCSGLPEITIPESVTSIGDYAFSWCSGLTEITIPEGVTSIGVGAFCWCRGLTEITIPEGVTSIGDDAFSWCSSLTEVTIPESVKSIGDDAFFCCSYEMIICVYENSAAHTYAKKEGLNFKIIGSSLPPLTLGDFDNDGKVTSSDVISLKKSLLSFDNSLDKQAADINGDGKVNVFDLARLKQMVLG